MDNKITKTEIRNLFLKEIESEILEAERYTELETFQDFWKISEHYLYRIFGDKYHGIQGRVRLYSIIHHALTDDGEACVVMAEIEHRNVIMVIPYDRGDVTANVIGEFDLLRQSPKHFKAITLTPEILKKISFGIDNIDNIELKINALENTQDSSYDEKMYELLVLRNKEYNNMCDDILSTGGIVSEG